MLARAALTVSLLTSMSGLGGCSGGARTSVRVRGGEARESTPGGAYEPGSGSARASTQGRDAQPDTEPVVAWSPGLVRATASPSPVAVAALPDCVPPSEAGRYALPTWVVRGRSSPGERAPLPGTSSTLRARLQGADPADPATIELQRSLAQSLLQDAEDAAEPAVRERALQDAVRALAVVVQQSPDSPRIDTVLFDLGWALQQLEQHDRARQVYFMLVRRHPDSRWVAPAYLAFADFYFAQGDFDAAERFYEKVTELPDRGSGVRAYARYREAAALARLEQHAAARERLAALEQELARDPDVPDRDALTAAIRRDGCGLTRPRAAR